MFYTCFTHGSSWVELDRVMSTGVKVSWSSEVDLKSYIELGKSL